MTKGTEGAEKPLDKMTVKELREIAHAITDLKGIHGMNKQDLLDAVKAHRGIKEEKNQKSQPVASSDQAAYSRAQGS